LDSFSGPVLKITRVPDVSYMRWLISLYQLLCAEGIIMQSRLWSIIIVIFILGIGFSEESNAQEDLYKFGEFVRLLGGKAIKIDEKEDVEEAVRIEDESGNEVKGDDIGEGSKIKPNRRLRCQPGYNFALKTKGGEIWLNYGTKVQVMEKDRNKGNIIAVIDIEEGEICADELNGTVFQLQIGETTVSIEPKKCRRFYLKGRPPIAYKSGGEITISVEGRESEVRMDESSRIAEIKEDSESPLGVKLEKYSKFNNLTPELSAELSKARKWQDTLERLEAQGPITTPFWRKPKFYIPTAAIAIGISAAVFYLAREQEVEKKAEVHIQIGMP
jgi:hypothetical protein